MVNFNEHNICSQIFEQHASLMKRFMCMKIENFIVDNNRITLHYDTPFLTKIMYFPICQQPFDLVSIVNNVASNNNLLQFIFFIYFSTLSPCHLKLCLKNISNNTIFKLKLKIP
jgi:hypothetical protein